MKTAFNKLDRQYFFSFQHIYGIGHHGGSIKEFESLWRDDGSRFPSVRIDPKQDVAILPYSSGEMEIIVFIAILCFIRYQSILEKTNRTYQP